MTRPKSKQGFWWLKVPFAQMRSDLSAMNKSERADYQDLLWLCCEVGSVPSDLRKLARLVQTTKGQLEDLMEIAGHHFTDNGDGTLSHIYVEEERQQRIKIGKVYAENRKGKKSAEPSKGTIVTPEGHNGDLQGAQANCNSPEVVGGSKPAAPKAVPSAAEAEDAETAAIMAKGGDSEGWS